MSNPTSIVLVSTSSSISFAQLQVIAEALDLQVSTDFAKAWNLSSPPRVVAQEDPFTPIPAGAWLETLSDTIVDPADLASHWDELGLPVGQIQVPSILGMGATVFGAGGVASATGHEALEMLGDQAVNQFYPMASPGIAVALEVCDPVQGSDYQINGVYVPNFVLPAWFDLASQPGEKLDHGGLCSSPQQVLPGGYVIQRAADGTTSDIFGDRLPPIMTHRRAVRHNFAASRGRP